MSSKQDRTYSRTATDVERKYNFGKTFAEVMGMCDDAQKAAEQAQEAADKATSAFEGLDQDAIFNLLTNNGEIKGLFMKDGQLYINASYLATGVIKSENGKLVIDLSGENEPTFNTGISTNGLTVRGDHVGAGNVFGVQVVETGDMATVVMNVHGVNGTLLSYLQELFSGTTPVGAVFGILSQDNTQQAALYSEDGSCGLRLINGDEMVGYFHLNSNGKTIFKSTSLSAEGATITGLATIKTVASSSVNCTKLNGKTISWKDNGDGTYTLIGQ